MIADQSVVSFLCCLTSFFWLVLSFGRHAYSSQIIQASPLLRLLPLPLLLFVPALTRHAPPGPELQQVLHGHAEVHESLDVPASGVHDLDEGQVGQQAGRVGAAHHVAEHGGVLGDERGEEEGQTENTTDRKHHNDMRHALQLS